MSSFWTNHSSNGDGRNNSIWTYPTNSATMLAISVSGEENAAIRTGCDVTGQIDFCLNSGAAIATITSDASTCDGRNNAFRAYATNSMVTAISDNYTAIGSYRDTFREG